MAVERFVYVVAFSGNSFVMVRHKQRAWEMPGGRLLKGETYEDGARREFIEETGMTLDEIICEIGVDLPPGGKVYVGLAGPRVNCELSEEIMEVREFASLPDELSFPLVEYMAMLEQGRTAVERFKTGKAIGRTASPLTTPWTGSE